MAVQERSDPIAAEKVIERVFEKASGTGKSAYLDFLAASVNYLSQHHPDRWGVTLFAWGVRLNVGMVESLVLHSEGLRVLVDKFLVDSVFEEGTTYRYAPGCAIVSIRLLDVPAVLASLAVAHHSALSVAAKRKCTLAIRGAHSLGVTKLLRLPNPEYTSTGHLRP